MIRISLLIVAMAFGKCLNAQTLYKAVSSETSFFSEAPLEDISAINKEAQSLLNTANNDIVVIIGIRGFDFENSLMEEHFNENYLESDKYKLAVFKGKINEKIDFQKDGTYDVSATGTFDLHGVTQERSLSGTLTIKGTQIILNSKFKVALKDHEIKIPKAVLQNIAEIVDVTTTITYEPKK